MKFTFTHESKDLDGMIAAVTKMSGEYHGLMHIASVSACLHLIEHGNPIYMNKLFVAVGNGVRREPLAKFFIAQTGVKYKKPEKGETSTLGTFLPDTEKLKVLRDEYKKDADAFIGNVAAIPFWELVPETIFGEKSLKQKLGLILAEFERYSKGEKDSKGTLLSAEEKAKIDLVGLEQLRGFMLRLKSAGTGESAALH